ncbi:MULTISPECIES: hypothetical protein [unclassified Clostridium]|nr:MULTISPECIES: hypothetical protein [unclassified Clostridium]
MEKEVKELFNIQVLEEYTRRFGIDISTLNLIGNFHESMDERLYFAK